MSFMRETHGILAVNTCVHDVTTSVNDLLVKERGARDGEK